MSPKGVYDRRVRLLVVGTDAEVPRAPVRTALLRGIAGMSIDRFYLVDTTGVAEVVASYAIDTGIGVTTYPVLRLRGVNRGWDRQAQRVVDEVLPYCDRALFLWDYTPESKVGTILRAVKRAAGWGSRRLRVEYLYLHPIKREE